jgi:hypothetical protein
MLPPCLFGDGTGVLGNPTVPQVISDFLTVDIWDMPSVHLEGSPVILVPMIGKEGGNDAICSCHCLYLFWQFFML